MKSGCCEFSISSGMNYYLSIFCRCLILVLTRMSCSIKVLLDRGIDVVYWFVLRFA